MAFTKETARAAGLKSAANRTPEVHARVAAARWGAGYQPKTPKRAGELMPGPVRTYWIDQVAKRFPDEFPTMSAKALLRRATLLARQAGAEAVAGPAKPTTPDAFTMLRAELAARKGADK